MRGTQPSPRRGGATGGRRGRRARGKTRDVGGGSLSSAPRRRRAGGGGGEIRGAVRVRDGRRATIVSDDDEGHGEWTPGATVGRFLAVAAPRGLEGHDVIPEDGVARHAVARVYRDGRDERSAVAGRPDVSARRRLGLGGSTQGTSRRVPPVRRVSLPVQRVVALEREAVLGVEREDARVEAQVRSRPSDSRSRARSSGVVERDAPEAPRDPAATEETSSRHDAAESATNERRARRPPPIMVASARRRRRTRRCGASSIASGVEKRVVEKYLSSLKTWCVR